MRLIHFRATKVHGHYNFDLKFFPDITFLVGINGSGKTTALRLIQAALTIDLSTLLSIKFSELAIDVIHQRTLFHLEIFNTGNNLIFKLNGEESSIKFPFPNDDERTSYVKSERIDSYLEEQRLVLLNGAGKALGQFAKSQRPLFLGLERRAGRYDDEPYYYDEDVIGHAYYRNSKRVQRETLDGLENCQRLIERAYRNFRRMSDTTNSRLINVIVDSMFDYVEFDSTNWPSTAERSREFQRIIGRRAEIERFATDLGGSRVASEQINNFFSKISGSLNEEVESEQAIIEWLLNKAQIQRIHKLLAEMDRQNKRAERLYAPIQEFVDILNRFFQDSRKTAAVDSLGKLNIHQRGAPIQLSSMSSGEKQLLILLAHGRFARSQQGVIIVDEPEISLHLRWQEMLIDSISPEESQNQFIFATHSPEIVGYRKSNCIQVG